MSNKAANVTVGKPKIGGAVFRAPLGTTLPTDAKSELDPAFVNVGYISEDGVRNNLSKDTEKKKAWGGDNVLNVKSGWTDDFMFAMLEALNTDVLKTVHGTNNVTGDLESGIEVDVNGDEDEEFVWVFDMIMRGNVLKRMVVFDASVTNVDEIVYNDTDPVAYAVTVSAIPNAEGSSHKEYIEKK